MSRPLLIDWYCCEGGAAKGYYDAGFDVVGIDHKKQRNYPFEMLVCNALDVPDRLLAMADAHHASPPCQFGSEVTPKEHRHKHFNLIPSTRAKLQRLGKPYVIENVRKVAEHLINPVSFFGTMFDLHCVDSQGRRFDLSRERCFETNWPLCPPWDPGLSGNPVAGVYGGHFRVRSGEFRTGKGTGRTVDLPGEDRKALAQKLMEMPWATMLGMSEAVPPVFTEEIGRQLLIQIELERMGS